ncbi:CBS domain-containing protein [Leeuwenhoekiella aequorea]|uniref:CBS domain protein n=1 Tax=Leeuwenhoekiella aequorea TaxID=283736 RepID=A0A4Q0PD93_9FLAO|nr:CBS domain-containing protein [Leeuwenhoekiella aequorea]RXG24488.1 CBS domain protein [Leeuwenhoekiella aequorea]
MGIKSFMGKRSKVIADEVNITVADYMTRKLITFTPDQSIMEVMEKLIKNRISGAPVINENNELLGVISEGDCIKHISDSRYHNLPMLNATVGQNMAIDVETIDANMNVFDAARFFIERKHRRFPIVEDGKLIGQISQMDVIKAALQLKGATWK